MNTATTVIVETITSERDRNGNCYHLAVFYNPAKGRQQCVRMGVGGQSNARHIAYRLAGNDWERTLCFESTVPKSQFKRLYSDITLYEGDVEANAALAALFGVKA